VLLLRRLALAQFADSPHRSGDRPYERTIAKLIKQYADEWSPDTAGALALGCPTWLAARIAGEAGTALNQQRGGICVTILAELTVIGCPQLDAPGAGILLIQDLITGWWDHLPTRCHPDVPPHRWIHFTLALDEGLNPDAALDVALIAS
jgi:hypothetical protein